MFLQYGSYIHQEGECWVSPLTRDGDFVNGIARGYMERWHVSGQLHGADQPTLTTLIGNMLAAYKQQGQDINFYLAPGVPSALQLLNGNCLGGTRVVQPPFFGDLKHGQYTTFVDYTLTLEGYVPLASNSILAFRETLSFTGGGPLIVWVPYLTGSPQAQTIYQATTYKITQRGEAMGYLSNPVIPNPYFPAYFLPAVSSTPGLGELVGPDRTGALGSPTYMNFRRSWTYHFESDVPLFGTPNLYPA